TRIRVDLAQKGIRPQRWELEVLARGATVSYEGQNFAFTDSHDWSGFAEHFDLFE
ncbi:replication A protein, partial [Escherichia coli]|nr:replication A protein [Escherichia coli]